VHKYKKSFIDELDTVYVALTRARCELYAFVPKRASSSLNPARLLIPGDVERGAPLHVSPRAARVPAGLLTIPVARYENWITLLKDEFTDDTRIKNRENIQRGEQVHYALSCLGNLAGKEKEREIKKALEKTAAAFPLRGDAAALGNTVRAIVDGTATRRLFFIDAGTVFQEKEVVDGSGSLKRIDRLIVTADEAIIVDYKSSREGKESHERQVKEYMKIVGAIYPRKTITGTILYVDTASVEGVAL
jgi:ATP-dependent exoDNAse (exonuclease V) beta subunit